MLKTFSVDQFFIRKQLSINSISGQLKRLLYSIIIYSLNRI